MKHLISILNLTLVSSAILFCFSAQAKKVSCTDEPKNKWMKEEAFKQKAEADGYKIKKFKTPGNCYEIYGTNKEGQKVEVYFNPVDGSVVKIK